MNKYTGCDRRNCKNITLPHTIQFGFFFDSHSIADFLNLSATNFKKYGSLNDTFLHFSFMSTKNAREHCKFFIEYMYQLHLKVRYELRQKNLENVLILFGIAFFKKQSRFCFYSQDYCLYHYIILNHPFVSRILSLNFKIWRSCQHFWTWMNSGFYFPHPIYGNWWNESKLHPSMYLRELLFIFLA